MAKYGCLGSVIRLNTIQLCTWRRIRMEVVVHRRSDGLAAVLGVSSFLRGEFRGRRTRRKNGILEWIFKRHDIAFFCSLLNILCVPHPPSVTHWLPCLSIHPATLADSSQNPWKVSNWINHFVKWSSGIRFSFYLSLSFILPVTIDLPILCSQRLVKEWWKVCTRMAGIKCLRSWGCLYGYIGQSLPVKEATNNC